MKNINYKIKWNVIKNFISESINEKVVDGESSMAFNVILKYMNDLEKGVKNDNE